MSSAREPDQRNHPDTSSQSTANRIARLRSEILEIAGSYEESQARNAPDTEPLQEAASRWAETLALLYKELDDDESGNEDRERLRGELEQRDAELRALRGFIAERDLALRRERDGQEMELERAREKTRELERRLAAAEQSHHRDEEIREIKRGSHERERELRRTYAERLSATEQDARRRISAIRDQREADNRALLQRQAEERADKDEQVHSLRLRREAEARAYSQRIEELVSQRSTERTSLEEAVAKLREKHEAERSRLQERVEELEEYLEEQEAITVELLRELGYHRYPGSSASRALPVSERGADGGASSDKVVRDEDPGGIRGSITGPRSLSDTGNRLREGLSLFNETEHLPVVVAIRKSLGDPEVYAGLQDNGGTSVPAITFVWPGMGWRRYVADLDHGGEEPRVYLAGDGEYTAEAPVGGAQPNARLDAAGRLALGVRPL